MRFFRSIYSFFFGEKKEEWLKLYIDYDHFPFNDLVVLYEKKVEEHFAQWRDEPEVLKMCYPPDISHNDFHLKSIMEIIYPINSGLIGYTIDDAKKIFAEYMVYSSEDTFKILNNDFDVCVRSNYIFDPIQLDLPRINPVKKIDISFISSFRRLYWTYRSKYRKCPRFKNILKYIFLKHNGFYPSEEFMKFIIDITVDYI